MPEARLEGLPSWSTDEVAEAYLAALRGARLSTDPAVGRLQSEWARRPAGERVAALRRFRDRVAGPGKTLRLLADWSKDVQP